MQWTEDHPTEVCYKLNTPLTFQLTPTAKIQSLEQALKELQGQMDVLIGAERGNK